MDEEGKTKMNTACTIMDKIEEVDSKEHVEEEEVPNKRRRKISTEILRRVILHYILFFFYCFSCMQIIKYLQMLLQIVLQLMNHTTWIFTLQILEHLNKTLINSIANYLLN